MLWSSFARCIDILLNGGFTAAGRDHVAAAGVEPTENITTLLPTGYLASLFGKDAQVTSVAQSIITIHIFYFMLITKNYYF